MAGTQIPQASSQPRSLTPISEGSPGIMSGSAKSMIAPFLAAATYGLITPPKKTAKETNAATATAATGTVDAAVPTAIRTQPTTVMTVQAMMRAAGRPEKETTVNTTNAPKPAIDSASSPSRNRAATSDAGMKMAALTASFRAVWSTLFLTLWPSAGRLSVAECRRLSGTARPNVHAGGPPRRAAR